MVVQWLCKDKISYICYAQYFIMATIKFFTRSKSDPAKLYIRFTNGRSVNIMRPTPLVVNPDYFNNKTGKVRQISHFKDREKLTASLTALRSMVSKQFADGLELGTPITPDWLQNCINTHFNLIEITDNNYLENYCIHYVEKLKLKTNDKTGGLGASKATVTKYNTIKTKIIEFQKHSRKKYRLTDVNLKFRDSFLSYLLDVDKLGRNTSGRYLKFLKTICLDAQRSGFKVSPELPQVKGFRVEVKKIYLNFDELEKIENTDYKSNQLEDAKDWLLIGCYIGQRAGDLLQLTTANLKTNGKLDFIELVQQKTKKRVSILVHPKVREILDKRNGHFPPPYSENIGSAMTIFNKWIKKVCLKAGLTEIIEGGKVNEKTSRKENGKFPKYQLITSHICRRSFASNFYGEMPTALLLNVTGHSTEKEFLNYIGKTSIDYAEQMAQYYNLLSQKQAKETVLRKVK